MILTTSLYNKIICTDHDEEIQLICREKTCQKRALCRLCYKIHEKHDSDAKLILMNEIKDKKIIEDADKFLTALEMQNDESLEAVKVYIENIEFLFKNLVTYIMKKLDERKNELINKIKIEVNPNMDILEKLRKHRNQLSSYVNQVMEEFLKKDKLDEFIKEYNEFDNVFLQNEQLIMFKDNNKEVLINLKMQEIEKFAISFDDQLASLVNNMMTIIPTNNKIKDVNKIIEIHSIPTTHGNISYGALACNEKKNYLYTAGNDGIVRVWDIITFKEKFYFKSKGNLISKIKYIDQKECLLIGNTDKKIEVWDLERDMGIYLGSFSYHTGIIYSIEYIPELDLVFSGANDKYIRIWKFTKTCGHNSDFSWYSNANLLSSVSQCGNGNINTGLVGTQNVQSGRMHTNSLSFNIPEISNQCLLSDKVAGITSILYIRELGMITIGQSNGEIGIYNLKNDSKLKLSSVCPLSGHKASVFSLSYVDEKGLLFSGSDDGTIRIWKSNAKYFKFEKMITIKPNNDLHLYVRTLIVLYDKDILICMNGDTKLRIIKISTGDVIKELDGQKVGDAAVMMGKRLLPAHKDIIKVWKFL